MAHSGSSGEGDCKDHADRTITVARSLQHTYFDSIVQGNEGAFRAGVVGVTDKRMRFFGWLELTGGKISKYIVGPEPGD